MGRPVRLRVALDQCVSVKLTEFIENTMGHQVVARAREGEPDESWLSRGFKADADVYVTADKACEIFAKAVGKRVLMLSMPISAKEITRQVERFLDDVSSLPRVWR